MTIQPTISFSFAPTCQSFRCCCCSGSEEEFYPKKSGEFKPMAYMTDKEVEKANERFREIIIRKLDPLPLDNDDFLERLEFEQGVSLKVTRDQPLTRKRLEDTVKVINRMLREMHVD